MIYYLFFSLDSRCYPDSMPGFSWGSTQPRHINNYSAKFRDQCADLAKAVEMSYGPEYRESVDYLRALARNSIYVNAPLVPLRWHQIVGVPPHVGAPVHRFHPAVQSALLPGVALRATFGGNRRV